MNIVDRQFNSALSYACLKGNSDIAYTLLEFGADPEERNADNLTPIDLIVDCDAAELFRNKVQDRYAAGKRPMKSKIPRPEKPAWLTALHAAQQKKK